MGVKLTLRDIAERGELGPIIELRAYWHTFTDCDPVPDGFEERMERAGLITLREVDDGDLDEAFAAERGIEPGGLVWDLSEAGRAALSNPKGGRDE